MDATTVLLITLPVALVLLAMIPLIAWTRKRTEAPQKVLASAHNLETIVAQLQESVEHLEAQQERTLERLQHLEAIVTSADWDILQSDAIRTPLRVPLDDLEGSEDEQVAQLAKWVR